MYDIDFTSLDPFDIELVRAHSPRFWDTDAGELATGHDPDDPWTHPSVDVWIDGWDDPEADAQEILTRTVIGDHRLAGLAEPPTRRPQVHRIDELFLGEALGAEAFHERVLALVPVATDGAWPADTGWEVRAA